MTTTAPARTAPPRRRPTTLADEFRTFRRHPNARIEAAAVAITITARLALGGWGSADAVIAGVIVAAQPFFEWVFHVYVLHYRPVTILGWTIDFELARKHREHHIDPTIVDLVFVPRRSLLTAIITAAVAAVLAFPTVPQALTALAVGSVLLAAYEWTHYLIHSQYRPKSRLFRALWRAHRLHHYKNEQYWFGVTNPTADHVLRTFPDPAAVSTSPTARDLAAR